MTSLAINANGAIPSRRQTVALVLGVWTVYGVFFSVQLYLMRLGTSRQLPLRLAFGTQMVSAYVFAAATFWVIWMSRRWRIERDGWRRRLALHLASSVAFAVVLSAVHISVEIVFYELKDVQPDVALRGMLGLLDREINTYWAIVFLTHTWDYYWRFARVQLRASQLDTQLANAKLDLLRAQVQPHFLFNALNTISSVNHQDPVRADRLIESLAHFLRATLAHRHTDEMPLRRELELLDSYLEIQRVRYEDQLRVELDVDPPALDALVPSLLLQPIVENAIKFGFDPEGGVTTLTIAARVSGGDLVITVRDRGPASPPPSTLPGLGMGLANTRSRLELLYGPLQSLEVEREAGGFGVAVRMPLRRAGDADARTASRNG